MPGARLSWAAALVLAVSLALKLAVQDVAVAEDQRAAMQSLAASLVGQGYTVVIPRTDVPIAQLERAGCRFRARVLDPHGTYRDAELLKLPRGWAVSYLWRGSVSESLPRLGPLSEYYFARELARLGVGASRAPVVMLSREPRCAAPGTAGFDIRVRLKRSAAL